jgi:uncharacterized protein
VIRPYAAGGRREIISQPKVYGFDTGFVAYCRSWTDLRQEDLGTLWEHLVLETLLAFAGQKRICFWRNKQQCEVDFVLPQARSACDAIECKWSAQTFEARGLRAFRENYPHGRNFVISPQPGEPYSRRIDGMEICFAHARDLGKLLG